jgi:hypothetical protein
MIGTRWLGLAALLLLAAGARGQDNYEIQVYGAETVAPGMTMVEVHSNVTARGEDHAVRETLELTHGFNDWFETGFYVFTTAGSGQGWSYVGDHIRPRVRVPPEWKWPVGVSLSTEIGYVRARYADDTWSWEVRPIIDKTLGRWYLAFNPALEKSLHGANAGRGFELAPAMNVKFDVTPKVAAGIEYYGALGPLSHFDPSAEQSHQIFPSIDLNLSPDWEFNAGIGYDLKQASDRVIVKFIVGRRTH